MGQFDPDVEESVSSKTDEELDEPPMYRVMLLNDDYTTMEFVVEILVYVFQKSTEEAMRIMLNVHHNGIGICGVYTHEVAETKVEAVGSLARENGFPLKCIMERE
ncbi:MAG: ATP-dependent Clp protease adapter ClpS [Desulfobacterales bacterium]|nr:ATP-dependent Clp protease adapter ClpS [Deltaproteobacteria bacterium]NNL75342.1 ATP-dependent Clp protease adapter ClpS [Desulfobacterales bacterium]